MSQLASHGMMTMTAIYEQHDAAFKNVSAYIVLKGDKVVAKVAFKFGGAVTAYVHWIGLEMTKGRAGGGGYDRQSAAVAYAARKIPEAPFVTMADAQERGNRDAFLKAARADGGQHWDGALRDAGFTVIQAI